MKCCVSTNVETWTNWLTFEPDLDHSPDTGTGLLSPISYALQRGIYYVGIIPCLGIGRPSLQRRVVFEMVLFTASCGNNFVGGKCAPPSALLVASQLQGGARFRREKFFVIMRLLTTLLLYTRNFSALN